MSRKRAEDLGSVIHVVLVSYPAWVYMNGTNDTWPRDVLVGVIKHERKVKQECDPLTREQEKEGEESVSNVFWQNKLGLRVVRVGR